VGRLLFRRCLWISRHLANRSGSALLTQIGHAARCSDVVSTDEVYIDSGTFQSGLMRDATTDRISLWDRASLVSVRDIS
jgi:hypothetical protein